MSFFFHVGRYFTMLKRVLARPEKHKMYIRQLFHEIDNLGVNSVGIVIIISIFIGGIMTIQFAYSLANPLYPKELIGLGTRDTLILEFSSTMLALIMAGKIGSNITSEIGTMRVSEQIDALESLSFDPVSFLILPRVLAAAIMFPMLIIIADCFGIIGGLFAAVNAMDVSHLEFIRGLRNWFRPWDAWFGLIKGLFFGVAITSIACYQGYYTTGGATGVGRSTTATVVISCVAIVFLDYILAAILL